MALVKSVSLPSGITAEYFRIVAFRWDRNTREAAAAFALFKDAATAVSGQPVSPGVAKLKLYGDKFDEYLSLAALAAASSDVVSQLYTAAKAVSFAYSISETTDPLAHVVCDMGKDIFADASDA